MGRSTPVLAVLILAALVAAPVAAAGNQQRAAESHAQRAASEYVQSTFGVSIPPKSWAASCNRKRA
jgi:hypothetical protein